MTEHHVERDEAEADREPRRPRPSLAGRVVASAVDRGRGLVHSRDAVLHHGQEPLTPDDQADLAAADPGALLKSLESSERFRRDTGLGAIYHPGKLSFREVKPTDSLHIIIDGDRISAHIDDISPFKCRPDGTVRYSLSRIVAHNVAGMSSDLFRLARGRVGRQRCKLECERVWVDDEPAAGGDEDDHGCGDPRHASGAVADLVAGDPSPDVCRHEVPLEGPTPPG